MKKYNHIILTCLLAGLISCGTKTDAHVKHSEYSSAENTTADTHASDTELIHHVYVKFVFAIEPEGNDNPQDYFTSNALKSLQDDYEFDCGSGACYAYYALRTAEQDSRPNSDEQSLIYSIEPDGDDWYTVSYSDMGWPGKTRVRIVDGKIDMYERLEPQQ